MPGKHSPDRKPRLKKQIALLHNALEYLLCIIFDNDKNIVMLPDKLQV